MAAFSAARRVARIRFSVAAETGVPSAWCWRMIAVNMACTCPADPSAAAVKPGRELQPDVPAAMTATLQLRAVPAELPSRDRIDAPAPPVKPPLISHDHRPRIAWSDLPVASSIRPASCQRQGRHEPFRRTAQPNPRDTALRSEFIQDDLR